MRMLVPVAAASLLASSALAQPATTQQQPPVSEVHAQASRSMSDHRDLRQAIREDLQKAGFTDIRVVPDSFLVQAKDRGGNPVTMILGPTSMTAIVAQTSSPTTNDPTDSANAGNNATNGANTASNTAGTTGMTGTNNAGTTTDASNGAASESMFTTVPSTDRLSTQIVGLSVYNNTNQDIGTIKDIAYSNRRVQAYIVAVGGFLGMGDRYVAVDPSDIKVTYDTNAKKWHASMDATADQLKSAPVFTYPSNT